MKHRIIHYGFLAVLFSLLLLVTAPAQAQTEQSRQVTIIQDMASIGLTYGQTMRVTLFNPPSPGTATGTDAQRKPVGGHVKVFDGSGALIAQSPELLIPPGEFRFFDFKRAALPLPGESDTGRLQARTSIVVTTPTTNLEQTPLAPTIEVIDDITGRTLYSAGKTFLIFVSTPTGRNPAN